MNETQVIFAIYNYLFSKSDNLNQDVIFKSRFMNDTKIKKSLVFRYYLAKVKLEFFKEFMVDILEILRYYEGEGVGDIDQ